MAGHDPERLLRPRAADQDRQAPLDRTRRGERVSKAIEPALVAEAFPVEQAPDDLDRLGESIEPLPEAAPEVEPERRVLILEPAAAEAEDRPPVTDLIQGRGELRRQPRVAERVRCDQQPEPDAGRDRGGRGEGRPAFELGIRRIALVRQEMVVDPDVVRAG